MSSYTQSDRGLKYYEGIPRIGLKLHESSNATEPKIWINNDLGGDSFHLTTSEALELAEQLVSAVRNHYQLQD